MVVTAHPEATKVGLDVLRKGGNAVDAMVAVQFALAVVYPNAGNIGGGGFMVYRAADGAVFTLDFREKAPLAATKNMYLDEDEAVIPKLSLEGYKAAGVPGSVDGMVKAHERFGKMSWADLIAPAVQLAQAGFAITAAQADDFNRLRNTFLQNNSQPEQIALIREESWKAGDPLVQPQLGATLERIQQEGREGFYAGQTASIIADEMRRYGGLITEEDLQQYESVWREPVVGDFGPYKVISMGPPSSGGVALLQLLHMSKQFPLQQWGYHTTKTIHAMAEMERRVYLDRSLYLADPDFRNVPLQQLLDTAYLGRKAENISLEQATISQSLSPAQETPVKEHEQTTHFSIVDTDGNAVSLTTTINNSYGSRTFVAGAGFLLNNEMDDFSIKPGTPNYYGLVGGEANAIAPGKRMLSSMTPTIVEKKGQLHLVLGTPGGATIITSVYQTIINITLFDMDIKDAVWAGRFHHQWLPDQIFLEEGAIPQPVQDSLQAMGHTLQVRSPFGRVDAIMVRDKGQLVGAGDPRGDDMAGGF
ncbi:gamma-glutamyltranspeptidase [Flammeovirgaceae bacterium 311]|nr:gamma-glutamyltranspeptidase [Flammeovirgaceae bacterium 311]